VCSEGGEAGSKAAIKRDENQSYCKSRKRA
jgi:hypothetical protein